MISRKTFFLYAAVSSASGLYLQGYKPTQQVAAVQQTPPVTQPTESEKKPTEDASVDSEADALALEQEQPLVKQYESPFPDRTNLFQAPKRQGKGMVQSDGQSETSIELLGFVNVDRQQVVLSIDGLVAALPEGSKQDGIEVISIHPPSVILKRGKERWQASLEN